MITAAVLADEFVLDGLRDRIRPDALTVDEYGQTTQGAHGPLFGLDSVASLAACLHLLAENDGREITLNEHGSPGRGLPFLPPTSLTDLRRNGLITTRREGTSWRVGYGERTLAIAERWGIGLPTGAQDQNAASA